MTQVQPGDEVRIHFTGKLSDGKVFDSSEGREPLEFTAGTEELIEGISRAVMGMETGEKKTVTVPAEQAFGERQPRLMVKVPRSALPADVRVGDQVCMEAEDEESGHGDHVHAWVLELGEKHAVVDGNHPLAGQALTFHIELVSVRKGAAAS